MQEMILGQKYHYDFVKREYFFYWEVEDADNYQIYDKGYKLCEDVLIINDFIIRELNFFIKYIKPTLELSGSEYKEYFLDELSRLDKYYRTSTIIPVPKTEVSLIKTIIELYEENYNDRITNLKTAFEQRKLEQVQCNSISGKVSKSLQRNKPIRKQTASKPSKLTATYFWPYKPHP